MYLVNNYPIARSLYFIQTKLILILKTAFITLQNKSRIHAHNSIHKRCTNCTAFETLVSL